MTASPERREWSMTCVCLENLFAALFSGNVAVSIICESTVTVPYTGTGEIPVCVMPALPPKKGQTAQLI